MVHRSCENKLNLVVEHFKRALGEHPRVAGECRVNLSHIVGDTNEVPSEWVGVERHPCGDAKLAKGVFECDG